MVVLDLILFVRCRIIFVFEPFCVDALAERETFPWLAEKTATALN